MKSFSEKDVLQIAMLMWSKRFTLPESFKDYLAIILKEYGFNFDEIKNACLEHMDKNTIPSFLETLHMTLNEFQVATITDKLLTGTGNCSLFQQPIMRSRLCTKISESSDDWAKALWTNTEAIEEWIDTDGSDLILEAIFRRLQLIDSVQGKTKLNNDH